MGGGCLKILGCVGDPEENADVEAVEGKSLRSKRKWSIRKRSASGQVLSSNVMKEPACVTENGKDSSDTGSSYCCPATDAPVTDKILKVKFVDEACPIPIAKSSREVSDSLPVCKSVDNLDPINGPENSYSAIEESVAIAIQTGIRVYLAQKELAKVKNVIKLQAVVRGHLVRRQAIGTLRCVQAIVKMQALVRARHMKCHAEKLVLAGKAEGGNLDSKQDKMYYSSSEKLLANAFARLLMESAPSRKTKTIHISCDPSKSDSAWRWLERWMTVTASPQLCLSECAPDEAVIADTAKLLTEVEVALVPPVKKQEDANELENIEGSSKSEIPCEVTSKEHDTSELQNPGCAQKEGLSPLMKHDHNESTTIPSKESGASLSNQIPLEPDANQVSAPLGERHVVDPEKSRRTTKRMGESQEVEGKKSRFASEKSRSPAFAAVQSKFEELSANFTSNKSGDLHHESMDDKNSGSVTPQSCTSMKSEVLSSENASSNETSNQTAFSLCGTEISIYTTLGSLDSPKTEVEQAVLETEIRDHIGNSNVHDACVSETTSQPANNAVGNNCDTLQETMLSETGQVFDKSLSADDNIVNIYQQLPRQAPEVLLLEEPAVTDIPLQEPAVTDIPLQEPSATDKPVQEPMASDKPVQEPVIPNMPVQEPVASEQQLQEPVALNLLVQEPTELDIPLHDLASSDSPHQVPMAADVLHQEPVTPEMSYQETATVDMPFEEAATPAMPPQGPEAPVAVPQEPEASIVVPQESLAPTLPPEDPVACDTFSSEPTAPCIISEEIAPSIILSEKPSESSMSGQLEDVTVQQTCKSSPQGSPISHLTASEPQGTPSSEVSSKSKKSKTNNDSHSRKQRLQWSEKKSPSNTKAESGAKVAVENPQNPKSEKRRKSLGTAKPDHSDHEPRVSSNKSIPNYMQATESAKAKGHASRSPKASPDVHEKVGNTKKRHSLPSTNNEKKVSSTNNEKVSSPRMQRSPSQAQQPLKANGTPSPQNSTERKWQR